MILRLAAKRRWLAAAAVLVLATFGAAGLARAVTTPTNCAGCFAMVRSDATLVYYRGVKANYKPKPGEYYIDFLYPINKCALTATIDDLEVGKEVDRSYILLYRELSNRVAILSKNSQGSPVDISFSLVVTC